MPSRIQEPPGGDIPQLTGLRAVAAWMVFAFHHSGEFHAGEFGKMALAQSFIGVNIFFVLSGFLIPWRYAPSASLDRRWLAKYVRNRVARIYPLAALLLVFGLWNTSKEPMVWIRCLTLTQALTPGTLFAGIPQAWTLTVEECFYLSVPFIIVLGWRKWPLRTLVILTALFWSAGFCIYGPRRFFVQYTIFGRCFEFFAGMMLAAIFIRRPPVPKRGFPLATFSGILAIAACMGLMSACDQLHWPLAVWVLANNFALAAAVTLLFYGLIVERSILQWILATPPMVFCGRVSYAFYLIHWGDFDTRLGFLGFNFPERFALLMILASLLHLGYEEPMRRLIRGKPKKKTV